LNSKYYVSYIIKMSNQQPKQSTGLDFNDFNDFMLMSKFMFPNGNVVTITEEQVIDLDKYHVSF